MDTAQNERHLHARANWMSLRANALGNKKLKDICLPGSHNAATQHLERTTAPGTNAVAKVYSWRAVFPFAVKWSRCQNDTIREQLQQGIRYLDLRLTASPTHDGSHDFSFANDADSSSDNTGDETPMIHDAAKRGKPFSGGSLHITHSLQGIRLAVVLSEVADFVKHHEHEIIVLDFQHFYNFSAQADHAVVSLVKKHLNEWLITENMVGKTLAELWQADQRVLVSYGDTHDNAHVFHSNNWLHRRSDIVHSPWANVEDAQLLRTGLEQFLSAGRPKQDQLFVLQGVLTPRTGMILKGVGGKICCGALRWFGYFLPQSIQELATNLEDHLCSWLQEWHAEHDEPRCNVVMVDYATDTGKIIDLAIMLNNERHQRTWAS
eukprot:m.496131 g.496131  ORF g.496131 m.496131 type:complete len:378 (-) comp21806_c0_seq5:271-1404(-)